jgi:hypothetical protein
LEARYQAYRDRINFVWVYGREAHPGQDCWDHPEGPTKTMAERAQRARWMKTDPEPDIEMPVIIDYIADPPNEDEAIRRAYGGGRPNSGYVIDCDGRVLEAHGWAWAVDGTSPGSLAFGELERSLDAYLADPPACYRLGLGVDGSAVYLPSAANDDPDPSWLSPGG